MLVSSSVWTMGEFSQRVHFYDTQGISHMEYSRILELYQEADVKWASHVFRQLNEAPLLGVTRAYFVDGKRSRGRPKMMWKDCVEADTKVLKVSNCQKIELTLSGF